MTLLQLVHSKSWLHSLYRFANRHAEKIFLISLIAVVWHNWRLWQRDKVLLKTKASPDPLPSLQSWPQLPLVSVLVAAWNEAEHVQRHIESFLSLRYPHKELVLSAGGQDSTVELAKQYRGTTVKVLAQRPAEGKQQALAQAFLETEGDIIFLTDADCVLDDDAFERTVYPIAADLERACTGTSQPLPEQLQNPFVANQAASQLYSAMRASVYAPGLLGRNCAIERGLLEGSHGLNAPAATGTDYVLAKMLVQHGARIRQIPESRIGTHYPQTAGAYLRQQRRWLHNVVLHGRRFGAWAEVAASVRTSLIGGIMLVLPIAAWLVRWRWGCGLWHLLFVHALLSRLRYGMIGSILTARPFSVRQIAVLPIVLLLDFVAWIQPLLDYPSALFKMDIQ